MTTAASSQPWPLTGWSDQPDQFPVVTTAVILAHLLQTGKYVSNDTVQLTQKSLDRGHGFFLLGIHT